MEKKISFSEYDLDILKEVLNIGIGKGVSVVSEMINSRIELISPDIEIASEIKNMGETLESWCGLPSIGVSQEFVGDLIGITIIAFSKKSASDLVRLLLEYNEEQELYESDYTALEEVANCLINGTIGTLSNYIDIDLDYEVPRFFPEMTPKTIEVEHKLDRERDYKKQECVLIIKSGLKISKKDIYLALMIIIGIRSLEKIVTLTRKKYLHETNEKTRR
ncbi:MAG: hypothetical protein V1872_05735 [bacterium]